MNLKLFISALLVIFLIIISTIIITKQETGKQDNTIFREEDSKREENFQQDELEEKSILITLSPEVSFEDPSMFTAEYLGLTDVLSIEPLFEETRQAMLNGTPHLQGINDFHQILKVTLGKRSESEVLSIIKSLEQNPSIISCSPDYSIPLVEIE